MTAAALLAVVLGAGVALLWFSKDRESDDLEVFLVLCGLVFVILAPTIALIRLLP